MELWYLSTGWGSAVENNCEGQARVSFTQAARLALNKLPRIEEKSVDFSPVESQVHEAIENVLNIHSLF